MPHKHLSQRIKSWFAVFIKSVWLFPVILFIIVVLLSAFRISGTSAGIYHNFLYGDSSKDTDLIFGNPRSIRSDEWLFISQLTAAQSSSNFPKFNENIGSTGRDMSVIIDVPYKEWSALFKPQNLIFLVAPIEYAFAFKWWLLLFLLITSLYFLLLRIFNNKRLLASIFSIAGACSPFIFWWYQTATIAPLFYGLFIIILLFRIIDSEPIPKISSKKITNALYGVALAYLLTCFALVQYPPFQIPVVIVVLAVVLGKLLNNFFENKKSLKPFIKPLIVVACGSLVALILIALFILTRVDAIKDVAGTVYPGSRTVTSGGLKKYFLFDGFLMPQLQSSTKGPLFFNNQSETSNFILLLPFLFLPGLLVIYKEFRKKTLDWVFVALNAVGLLFIVRMFLPFGNRLFSILLLNKVPNERLVIGLGFASLLHTFYLVKKLELISFRKQRVQAGIIIYSVICLALLTLVGHRAKIAYPGFISSNYRLAGLALGFTIIIYLILSGRKLMSALVLLVFSIGSVLFIHPLYIGLGFVKNNPVSAAISTQSNTDAVWAVNGDILYENVAIIKNHDSLSGVQFYPDVNFWRGLGGSKNDFIYNRYAHVLFETPDILREPIRLLAPDVYLVQLNCGDFLKKELDYVVSDKTLDLPCTELLQTVNFPQKTFYLYSIDN